MIIEDKTTFIRSAHRTQAIAQAVSDLLKVAPQLAHLSILTKLTDWNPPSLQAALDRAGITGIAQPVKGKRLQVDTAILECLLSLHSDTDPSAMLDAVSRIKALKQVSDLSIPIEVIEEPTQEVVEEPTAVSDYLWLP